MDRRGFIKRMASAVAGVGMLGAELLRREPKVPEIGAGYARVSVGQFTRADASFPSSSAIVFPEGGSGATVTHYLDPRSGKWETFSVGEGERISINGRIIP